MPKFLHRSVGPSREVVHEFVEAEDLAEARRLLEAQGHREIEFLTGDSDAEINERMRTELGVDLGDEPWAAEVEAAARRRAGLAASIGWAFRQHLVVFGPLLAWNVISWLGARPLGWGDWLGFGLTLLYTLVFLRLILPMALYQRILEAGAWCDWAAQERFITGARRLARVLPVKLPESDLKFREAYALAAQGRLAEAVDLVQTMPEREHTTELLFQSRLSSVYEYAGDMDGLMACLRRAAEAEPDNASGAIDLARGLVMKKHDVSGAKAALARIDGRELSTLEATARDMVEGVIAFEEGRFAEAQEKLSQVEDELTAFAGNPLIACWEAETRAYLAMAAAGLGERDAARGYWAEARALLKVQPGRVLHDRVEQVVG